VDFTYANMNLSEFEDYHDLVRHLWALARRENTHHHWLREAHTLGRQEVQDDPAE
jgi:hypothetical protein